MYMRKTKSTPNKQFLCGLLFYRNARKTHTDQSILQFFLLSLKINNSQTLSVAVAQTFSPVFMLLMTCFDECFLLYVITGTQYFL